MLVSLSIAHYSLLLIFRVYKGQILTQNTNLCYLFLNKTYKQLRDIFPDVPLPQYYLGVWILLCKTRNEVIKTKSTIELVCRPVQASKDGSWSAQNNIFFMLSFVKQCI